MVTIPVFLSEKFHGQRSLADYSPWGCKESDMIVCVCVCVCVCVYICIYICRNIYIIFKICDIKICSLHEDRRPL